MRDEEGLIYYADNPDVKKWVPGDGISTLNNKSFVDLGNLIADSADNVLVTDRGANRVGQSPGLYRSYRTACERAEWLQIHRLPVRFSQKRVEKILMTELVVGILGDVGWHVLVNRFQSLPIGAIEVGKFGVLLPEIRLVSLPPPGISGWPHLHL